MESIPPSASSIVTTKWRGAIEITRFDKPIGTLLLLAPTLWGVVLASEGRPSLTVLSIFVAGAIVMRAAGCIANDLADRDLDGHVARTRLRPLVTGALSVGEAITLLGGLLVLALILVALTNPLTVKLSVIGAGLALVYPFMKRFTHWPQIVLGLAFSWSIPMAFAASQSALPHELWWLFAANVLGPLFTTRSMQWSIAKMIWRLASNLPPSCLATSMSESSPVCSVCAFWLFGAVALPLSSGAFITLRSSASP